MKTLAVVALFTGLAALGGGCAQPPLPEAPGAVAVAVARSADIVRLWETVNRAGQLDGKSLHLLGPAIVADAPMVISVLPGGAVVVATRVGDAASGLAAAARPVVGQTQAITLDGMPALVRVDGRRALVALHVPVGQETSTAAVLEVIAADKGATTPPLPAAGEVRLRVGGSVFPFALGDVDALVRLEPDGWRVTARADHASPEMREALTSAAPAWACSLDKNAAAVIAIPPLVVPGDAVDGFAGRVVLALYADGERVAAPSIVAAATPRDAAAASGLVEAVRGAVPHGGLAEHVEGSRTYFEGSGGPGARPLRAVVDNGADRRFLLAWGKTPLDADAVGPCAAPLPLVMLRGAPLSAVLLPALTTPSDLLRMWVDGPKGEPQPWSWLRGIARFDVDARTDAAGVIIDSHLSLEPVTH